MSDAELEKVFNSFCAFGAGSKDSKPAMDGAKFTKLFRDLKLFDKKFTSTDTDIIFSKPEVKGKAERKITFAQFEVALKLAADKKYGEDDEDRYSKIVGKIISSKGPGTSKTTKAVKTGAVDRLTDTSKYTGSHKERFDESGKGKGREGRNDFDEKASSGYVGAYKGKDTYDGTH